jgi:hypothetical protein
LDVLFRLLEQEWLGERSATTAKREEIDYAPSQKLTDWLRNEP